MADVKLNRVTKRFGAVAAVTDMDLNIAHGELFVLLGPTGAGKTTTLRLVAGLDKADAGTIHIGDHDMTSAPPAARDVAFVFQQYSLYPHMSAYDNMAFPLRSPARPHAPADVQRKVEEIATVLHIEDKLDRKATQLSGGEMQRVAIGRALVRDPAIYLMDEPLSSLDAKLRAELRVELKRIQKTLGATIIYVTHDQIEAMTMADRIGVMKEGRLVQVGTPREIYERPRNLYVASRLGVPAINLLPVGVLPMKDVAASISPQGVATIGARTEHLRIAKPHAQAEAVGVVDWIEHLGDQNHMHVKVGEHQLVTLAAPDSGLEVGDPVSLSFNHPLLFDVDGERIAKRADPKL